jgi:2-iminobutanoate/2-iminopropanoate deaminase
MSCHDVAPAEGRMSVRFWNPAELSLPRGAYRHVAVVDGWIFVSGQVSVDVTGTLVGDGDPAAQARQVLANVVTAVEAAGGAVPTIVKLTTFVTDRSMVEAVRASREPVFGDAPPTSSLLVVAGLAHPAFLVETEAVARVL